VGHTQPWAFLYRFGEAPAVALFCLGVVLLAWGLTARGGGRLRRRLGAFLVIALLVGPLLLANGVLKPAMGRPRPRQIEQFDGKRTYAPVLVPRWAGNARSFPSGHAAAGFAVLLPFFVLRHERRRGWAWLILLLGLGYGGLMSYARIVQGAHFFSDVLWSAGVIWFTGLAVERWLLTRPGRGDEAPRRDPSPTLRTLARGGALTLAAAVAVTYAAVLPVDEAHEWVLPLPSQQVNVRLDLAGAESDVTRRDEANGLALVVRSRLNGRGWPWGGMTPRHAVVAHGEGALHLRYDPGVHGLTTMDSLRLSIHVPDHARLVLRRMDGAER